MKSIPATPVLPLLFAGAAAMALASAGQSQAASYASGVTLTGTSVNFVLNEPAALVEYIINGGAPVVIDGTTAGTKSFLLNLPTDTFSIRVKDSAATGYTIPTGLSQPAVANGLGQATNLSGFNQISDDSNALLRFNSLRGVAVSTDPNAPNFGQIFVSNSTGGISNAGTGPNGTPIPGRDLTNGTGIFALAADFTDVLGGGNTAKTGGLAFNTSASSPYRIQVASNGDLYVTDWSDPNGQLAKLNPTLTAGTSVLAGIGGPTALPAGQNHGSVAGVRAVVTSAGLSLYTVDEDLTTSQVTGAGSTTDKNSLWRYDVGNSATPYSAMPVKIASLLVPAASADLDGGANGNLYLGQNRSAGAEAGLVVVDPGGTVLWDSLTASRALLGDPLATDILRNVQGISISADQKWAALMLNISDVAVVPLDADGLPKIGDRLLVDTGTDVTSGRDVAFDAAGNIYYVSSGQALLRAFGPGGDTDFVTSWDGTAFRFAAVPEPSTAGLLALGAALVMNRRKSRKSA